MDTTTEFEAGDNRRWLAVAGLLAVPLYVLPVGIWGMRAIWPRSLRNATSGALVLGIASLVGLSLQRLARPMARRASKLPKGPRLCAESARWKLPLHGDVMPEEFAASCASGR